MQMRLKANYVLIVFITGWCFHQYIDLVSYHMHSKWWQIGSSTSSSHHPPWFSWWGLVMWTEQTRHNLPSSLSPASNGILCTEAIIFVLLQLLWSVLLYYIFPCQEEWPCDLRAVLERLLLKLHVVSSGRNMEAPGSEMIMFHLQTAIRCERSMELF